jgi:hypothetical protein
MTTREVLVEARRLIEKPEHWTKDEDARDLHGLPVDPLDDDAARWCIGGAIRRIGGGSGTPEVYDVIRAVISDEFISRFNDEHTHVEVLALFDKAIAACEDPA